MKIDNLIPVLYLIACSLYASGLFVGETGTSKENFLVASGRERKCYFLLSSFKLNGVNVVCKFLNRKFKGVRWMP